VAKAILGISSGMIDLHITELRSALDDISLSNYSLNTRAKFKTRVNFVLNVLRGDSVADAAEKEGLDPKTAYGILAKWKEKNDPKDLIPNYTGVGRRAFLDDYKEELLRQFAEENDLDPMKKDDIKKLITFFSDNENGLGISYTSDQYAIGKIRKALLRKKEVIEICTSCSVDVALRKDDPKNNSYQKERAEILYDTGLEYSDTDPIKAKEYFMTAAFLDHAGAAFEVGRLCENDNDNATALQYYLLAADKGDANAEYMVGFYYKTGKLVEKNTTMALIWYKKAADRGVAEAQKAIGKMFEEGDGVIRDRVMAEMCYARSENSFTVLNRTDTSVPDRKKLGSGGKCVDSFL